MLDDLWSTERIEIIHDGCEASRIQKIQKIITNQCALDHLRVCIDRTSGFYNCSECEKCIRTMISLHAFGVLDECKTFRGFDMNAELISKIELNEHTIIFQKENYNVLPEGEIKAALKIGQRLLCWDNQLFVIINDNEPTTITAHCRNSCFPAW